MCGRYELNANARQLHNHFGNVLPEEQWINFVNFTSYNVAPSLAVPVIRYSKRDQHNVMERLIWGYRPRWAKRSWINARDDTLFETAAFRESAAKRRCLVPATGWYEWQETSPDQNSGAKAGRSGKQPYYIHFGRVFAFAGVWTARKLNDENWELSFAVVTTGARGLAANIHERMPLVLHPRHYEAWLDPATGNAQALLTPFDDGRMQAYPVSTRVNDPKNDDAAVIAPLAGAGDE